MYLSSNIWEDDLVSRTDKISFLYKNFLIVITHVSLKSLRNK